MKRKNVIIYGDSLMKGTVIDERLRYHATIGDITKSIEDKFGLNIINRARFGFTSQKGKKLLQRDIEEGIKAKYALLEFGGNDCNFRWDEVSNAPDKEHAPLVMPRDFRESIMDMIKAIRGIGSIPVLMTLPPISGARYFDFVSINNSKSNILKWLGDVNMIYRFHELYSGVIEEIAKQCNVLLVDCRKRFLDKRNFDELIGIDGIHLAPLGYRMMYGCLEEFIRQIKGA